MSSKRISKECLYTKNAIVSVKRYIIVILLLLLIIPLLYLIPCNTSSVKIRYSHDVSIDNFEVPSYSGGISHNLLLSSNINETIYPYWRIKQISLVLSSYTSYLNTSEMLQSVIYDKYFPMNYQINTLTIETFTPQTDYQLGNLSDYPLLNDRFNYYECPVDYILSYLKITIESSPENQTEAFEVSFYHFFQEDRYIEIKLGLINEILISRLRFDNGSYPLWHDWISQTNTTIPDTYPYQIDLQIRRRNLLTDKLDIYSI